MFKVQINTPTAIRVQLQEITVPIDRYPQGYEAGFANGTEAGIKEGFADGKESAEAESAEALASINTSLRGHGGWYIQEEAKTLADVPGKIPYVYDNGFEQGFTKGFYDGKAVENDRFWDSIQAGGTRKDYNCTFRYWQNEYFHPKYKVVPSGKNAAYALFQWMQKLKKLEAAYVDLSSITGDNGQILCNRCDAMEEVEDIAFSETFHYYYTFQGCAALKKIAKINCSVHTKWTSPFGGCVSLEDVTFSGTNAASGLNLGECTKLSKKSIESVIGVLSDTATGKSVTLAKAAIVAAYGSTESEVWLSLCDTKPNWTISLV